MKVLITVRGSDIAPRFDFAMEVQILSIQNNEKEASFRTILLPRPSAEELCSLILKENVETVICGGIEEKHLKYLEWKKITVIDSVIGPFEEVISSFNQDNLVSGVILPGAVKA